MTALPEGPHFEFLLTTNSTAPTLPARISPEEISKLKEIPQQIKTVLKTFGSRASDVFNLGDRFRIYVLPEPGPERSLIENDSHIPELMMRTAKELVENSSRATPAPLGEALTSQFFVDILRAASSRNPETRSSITYNDASGTHIVPSLSPTNFVQPAAPPIRSRTATMQVTGVTYSARGDLRILLTNDHLEVSLTSDLEAVVAALQVSAIRNGVSFSGTIHLGDDDRWIVVQGGRISYQEQIAVQSAAG